MKYFYITLVFLGLFATAQAQPFKFNWQQCFFSEGLEKAMMYPNIISTEDGYLITCYEEIEGYPLFNDDIAVIKTDLDGNFLWKKTYGGGGQEGCDGIVPSTNGNFIIAGTINSPDIGVTIPEYLEGGGIWIFMIDSLGNRLWDKVIGSSPSCFGYGANYIPTPDGGILCRFNMCNGGGDVSMHYGYYDIWLVKINSTGQLEWDFTLGSDWFDVGGSIAQTSDGGFLVTSQGDIGTTGNLMCDTSYHPYEDRWVAKLVKLDSVRNIEWIQCINTSEPAGFLDPVEMSDGYLIAGWASSNDGDLTECNYHLGYDNDAPTSDIWLRKIGFSGNLIWQQCYGGTNWEIPTQEILTNDGNIIITGTTQSHNGDVIGYHDGGQPNCDTRDIWVLKVNGSNGELMWNKCIGTRAEEYLGMNTPAVKIDDRNYTIAITTGGMWPFDDRTCSDPEYENYVWLVNITDTTSYLGVNPPEEASRYIKVYPNPANDYTVFKYTLPTGTTSAQLQLRDLFGRLVKEEKIEGKEGQKLVNTASLSAGTYFYTLLAGNKAYNGKLMVVR